MQIGAGTLASKSYDAATASTGVGNEIKASEYFKVSEITSDTAFTEIHLHCPLRGSGNAEACYKLMNYDRSLMKAVGGELVVLESQSNSGKDYCRLAIRRKGDDTSDLVPAHEQVK